jgi:hypothetical protein
MVTAQKKDVWLKSSKKTWTKVIFFDLDLEIL